MARSRPPVLTVFPPDTTPMPTGDLPEHHRRGCPRLECTTKAVSYRCEDCGAYDPTGGGYWPGDSGPWRCREHLARAMRPPRRGRR